MHMIISKPLVCGIHEWKALEFNSHPKHHSVKFCHPIQSFMGLY